ncbi:hypothetical protein OSTOST_21616, partial [Ostertagia ostertagi]
YINYFSSLLSGAIRVNSAPLYLHRITVSHLVGRVLSLKIYERLKPVYQSLPTDDTRVVLFCCQINTCALDVPPRGTVLVFHKEELDLIF